MSDRKKLSGAQFRKRAAQKQLEEEKLLKKVPKISVVSLALFLFQKFPCNEQDEPSSSGVSVEVSNNLEQEQQSNSNDDDVEKNDNVGFELDDPATWNVRDLKLVDQIIHSNLTQNLEADFTKSERSYEKDGQTGKTVRKVSVHLFSSLLPNGEMFKRDWLLYSKSTGNIFCVPCLLFHAEKQKHPCPKVLMTGNALLTWLKNTSNLQTIVKIF